jgi:hypothetical protein
MDDLICTLQTVFLAQSEQQEIVPIDLIWKHVTSLDIVEAVTFIAFGTVWLFYGWRVFKILVTICFGLLGLFLGMYANERFIGGDSFWLGLICVVFFAVLSIPFMRWCVSLLGAASGGILTAGIWLALGLPEEYVWAGGLVGLIAGGMISFIVFKIAVILFTSLGGSVLVGVGALAVTCAGALIPADQLKFFATDNQWFLPVLILAPMAVGIYLQHRFIKTAQDWTV